MSRVKGPPTQNLRNFNKRLLGMSARLAVEVAKRAATMISDLARRSFDAGRNVYDSPRPLGTRGNALTLVHTNGAARDSLTFTSDGGTKIRSVMAANYVKYLIGKYKILPIGNAAMPERWQFMLRGLVARVLGEMVPAPGATAAPQLRRAA